MYDIIVVGAGHAGCEAILSSARMNLGCLLISSDLSAIARMSCNPAIGGVAKGQITREIDALGGEMGKAIDATGIHFRMLNRSKGPAMHSPRAQADKARYTDYMRRIIEAERNIDLLQDTVCAIDHHGGKVTGVILPSGRIIKAKAVILACGTFLNGLIHIGMDHYPGGRTVAEPPVHGLTENLNTLGFASGRLKTGTPPRIDKRSVDYSMTEAQPGDTNPSPFSFSTGTLLDAIQVHCHITHTTEETHSILKKGFSRSPLFTGKVQGVGPRYCPSIEDKIHRFPDKTGHQIFLEPEGLTTNEMYVNGFSTSLPEDIQLEGLRSIPGLGDVKMMRVGYAIEYDYFYPWQIKRSLETKRIENLYFAGQINGTSGYEEAAGQGLLAGINASLNILGREPLHLKRSDAYIGVLIDDLITKEMQEPYRMFTSSAEHRLFLRQDNADLRLRKYAFNLGLADDTQYSSCIAKQNAITAMERLCREITIDAESVSTILECHNIHTRAVPMKASALLKRPSVTIASIILANEAFSQAAAQLSEDPLVYEQVETTMKYEGYMKREMLMIEKLSRLEKHRIPQEYRYQEISGLSNEGREKLIIHQPETIGQASRILGVSPSDISILLVHLGR